VTETPKLIPRQWPPVQHVGAKYSCRGQRSDQPSGRFQYGTFTFRSNVVCRFALDRLPTQMLQNVTFQPQNRDYPLLTKQTQEQFDQIFQRVVPHKHFSNFLYYHPPPRPLVVRPEKVVALRCDKNITLAKLWTKPGPSLLHFVC
jgi:hypothetical protein